MFNKKLFLAGILLIPALFLCGFKFNYPWAKAEKNIAPVKTVVQKQNGVTVYYFYAKPRCASCEKIESYTKEAVSSLNNPNVEFKMVDLNKPENKHYYKDYGLYTKSVVLSKVKDGKEIKSKNLDKIWTKLGTDKEFKKYITEEINKIKE
ncbi:MAG TPA: nitrophenyl compound nitroreductase subunit ArsF family protein [Candidatus Gastranaerophilales bacterium]|nr:nitrophenyl compound nitroreductase subunit ArsF family protein [Candidatus Gastranaerophilales bacterium]